MNNISIYILLVNACETKERALTRCTVLAPVEQRCIWVLKGWRAPKNVSVCNIVSYVNSASANIVSYVNCFTKDPARNIAILKGPPREEGHLFSNPRIE